MFRRVWKPAMMVTVTIPMPAGIIARLRAVAMAWFRWEWKPVTMAIMTIPMDVVAIVRCPVAVTALYSEGSNVMTVTRTIPMGV